MVKKYSYSADREKRVSAHFKVKEFHSDPNDDNVFIDTCLVDILERVRTACGKPVHINSSYRNPAYNERVGGEADSKHQCGIAADITVSGMSPAAVYQKVSSLFPITVKGTTRYGGIGKYGTFVHVDVRQKRARWNG